MIKTDIASYIKYAYCGNIKTLIVAGSGTDNSAVTGDAIDRINFESAVLAVEYKSTLAAGKKANLKVEILQSSDGTNWDDAVTLHNATVATGASGGSTEKGVFELALNLANYKRYIKFKTTMDLDATGTDTAEYYSTLGLGGSTYLPI
jgi:hypothetical protein